MNRKLFEEVTGGDWLSRAELDGMRKERMGEGLETMEEEWVNLLRFSYTMEQFGCIKAIRELGATTSIVILSFDKDDIKEPEKTDEELLKSMQIQSGMVGRIARYIELDESLTLEGGGENRPNSGRIALDIWT